MTGWLILGGVLALLIIVLSLSVTVIVDYEEEVEIQIKYAFWRIFSTAKPKKNKNAKAAEKKKPKQKTGNKVSKSETKDTPAEESAPQKKLDLDTILHMLRSAGAPIRYFFRKIRITAFYIDCVVGGEDAAKAAIHYGVYSAVINSLMTWLKSFMRVSVGEVNLEVDFHSEHTDFFAHVKLKMRVITFIVCGIWFVVKFFKKPQNTPRRKAPNNVPQKSKPSAG